MYCFSKSNFFVHTFTYDKRLLMKIFSLEIKITQRKWVSQAFYYFTFINQRHFYIASQKKTIFVVNVPRDIRKLRKIFSLEIKITQGKRKFKKQ